MRSKLDAPRSETYVCRRKASRREKRLSPRESWTRMRTERVYVIKCVAVSDIKPLTRFSLLRKR